MIRSFVALVVTSTLVYGQVASVNDAFVDRDQEAEETLRKLSGDARATALAWAKLADRGTRLIVDPALSTADVTVFVDFDVFVERALESSNEVRDEWVRVPRSPEGGTRAGTEARLAERLAEFDRAAERGALNIARGALAEARTTASRVGREAALAEREAWLARLAPQVAAPIAPPTRLEFLGTLPIGDPETRFASERQVRPNAGLRPGLARMSATEFLVQSDSQLTRFRMARPTEGASMRLERAGSLDLLNLVDDRFVNTALPFSVPGVPGWGLAPVVEGQLVVCVQGRTRGADEPNALVALEVGKLDLAATLGNPGDPDERLAATLLWGQAGDRRLADVATGDLEEVDELAALATAEFQPDPLIVDDLVIAQARVDAGAIESWLVAFDKADGRLRWHTRLVRGSDRVDQASRFGDSANLASGRMSLVEGHVVVPTNLGTVSLVRARDGRVRWTIAYARRELGAAGGSGGAALRTPDGRWLVASPTDATRRFAVPFPGPGPVRVSAAEDDPTLVATLERGALTVSNYGSHETVRWHLATGAVDALHLDPKERYRGLPLALGQRLFGATDRGLYLFDLTRELYLLDFEPYPPRVAGQRANAVRGGDVVWMDGRILVLGRRDVSVWDAVAGD